MAAENPLVTVIALCYNHQKYVGQTLDSICGQSYVNIELIIIDDASKDESPQTINNWITDHPTLKPVYISNAKNQGICKCLNKGLSLANGSYLQIIACDDVMLPDKIDRQVSILEKNPQCAFVYSDAYLMNADGKWQTFGAKFIQTNISIFEALPSNLFEKLMLEKNFIPAPSVLVRKTFLTAVGGYDENLTFEDYDMWLRLSAKYDAVFMEQPTCLYRVHDKNMTHSLRNDNLHLVTQFKIFIKHIKINQKIDAAIELKLYNILMQLYYNRFSDISRYAKQFYTYFTKDKNLKFALQFPVGKDVVYRVLSRIHKSS